MLVMVQMPLPLTIKIGATPHPSSNKAKPIVLQITEDHTAHDVLQTVLDKHYKNLKNPGRYVLFAGKPGRPPQVCDCHPHCML